MQASCVRTTLTNVHCIGIDVLTERHVRIPTALIYATVAMVTGAVSVTSTLMTVSQVGAIDVLRCKR